jgi:hypothetical protein
MGNGHRLTGRHAAHLRRPHRRDRLQGRPRRPSTPLLPDETRARPARHQGAPAVAIAAADVTVLMRCVYRVAEMAGGRVAESDRAGPVAVCGVGWGVKWFLLLDFGAA